MTPDHDAIKAALAVVKAPCCCDNPDCTDSNWSLLYGNQADALAPTVAALMEQYAESYAADLRAEVEWMSNALETLSNREFGLSARAEAAEADRDAYAAEKVRAALLDAAEAIERDAGLAWERDRSGLERAFRLVCALRDRAGAS